MSITHKKVSFKIDSSDPAIIQPSDWNDFHAVAESGIMYGPSIGSDITSVSAGQNYFSFLRRKFNASIFEEYEFVKPLELRCDDYDFPAQSPGINLIAGIATLIVLTPVPLGVNGSNLNHKLFIQGAAGNDVAVISGGTAISGAATGTIIITSTLDHTAGSWSIRSATAGIQEAINTLSDADGGIVKIPSGHRTLYAGVFIGKNNIKISGCGFYSTFLDFKHLSDQILFNFDGTGQSGGIAVGNCIEYLTTSCTARPQTDIQPAISLNGQLRFWGRYLNISESGSGIKIQNNPNSDGNFFENCWIGFFNETGVDVSGGNSTAFFQVKVVSGRNSGGSGWKIKKTGEFHAINCMAFTCKFGFVFQPDGATAAAHCWLYGCISDNNDNDAFKIQPINNGLVSGLTCVNCYTSFSDLGIFLTGAGGRIYNVSFLGHRTYLNKKHGMVIIGGNSVGNITIDNSIFDSNGYETAEVYSGIYVDANASIDGLSITNNKIGTDPSQTSIKLLAGINLGYPNSAGPLDNVIITGNKIDESVSTLNGVKAYIVGMGNAVLNHAIIKDNLPEDIKAIPIFQVGAVLSSGNGTSSILTITGSGIVFNALIPVWKGREILIVKTDVGTCTFNTGELLTRGFRNSVVINQGQSVIAKHDGTLWNLFTNS